jgi:hypothetical protein
LEEELHENEGPFGRISAASPRSYKKAGWRILPSFFVSAFEVSAFRGESKEYGIIANILMAQLTLYLDEDTEIKVKRAAKAAGLSVSRWVANLIRERTADQWPDSVREMMGSWPDVPTADDLRENLPADVPREPL